MSSTMTAATLVRFSLLFVSIFALTIALQVSLASSFQRKSSGQKSPTALPRKKVRSTGTHSSETLDHQVNHSTARPVGAALRLHSILVARQKHTGEEQSFKCANQITSHRCSVIKAPRKDGRGCFNVVVTMAHGMQQQYSPPDDICTSELWLPARKLFSNRALRFKKQVLSVFEDSSGIGWDVSVGKSPIGRLSPSVHQQRRFLRNHWIVIHGLHLSSNNNTVMFCPSDSASRLGKLAASINILQHKGFPRSRNKQPSREPFFLVGHTKSGSFLYNLLQTLNGSSELRRRRDLTLQQLPSPNLAGNRANSPLPASTLSRKNEPSGNNQAGTSSRTNSPPEESPCQRVGLNISTETLQAVIGSGEIISPGNFQLFDCAGHCIESSPAASQHASILRLIQRKSPETFYGVGRQRPGGRCCVPTEFSQDKVEFLYRRNRDTMLISLENLIVTRCGCT